MVTVGEQKNWVYFYLARFTISQASSFQHMLLGASEGNIPTCNLHCNYLVIFIISKAISVHSLQFI